ncbi:MAG: bifunctional riboflavin kinase/FAD synthetase [Bacteroidota bacterium]|nr:bifunctional riboflavin kinase/FAD synthetase [Bacteroidota bacterium]
MTVHHGLDTLPVFHNAVITIGTFDGVHAGHRHIIAQLQEEARHTNGESVLITFHPHPRKVISSVPGDIKLLNTLDERIELLSKTGIDHLVIVPFNHHFAGQTAEEYISDFLFKYFHPHTIIIGYDHRFGKGRSGNYQLLENTGKQLGFSVKEIPEHILNEVTVSSTKIREALLHQNIDVANAFLGYDYFFEGLIIEGNKLGRTIGYPTANLQIENEDKLIPGNGVYAVEAILLEDKQEKPFKGMMNIGLRPTVDGKKRMIEVNIFDFNQDIYGKTLRVYVKAYLRGEVKFNGLEELKQQLAKDKTDALNY